MNRILIAAFLVAGPGLLFTPGMLEAQSQSIALPACASNGDMDGDGVPDAYDSDEKDSCLASWTGYEDCSTGAGDGIPDCQ